MLDLHGYEVHNAWHVFCEHIEDCLNRGEKQTYVITGFGMIQKELPLWCDQNAAIRKIENPKNNLGAYHIYFFKK